MLNAAKVHEMFQDCLYSEEEMEEGKIPEDGIVVETWIHTIVLHPERVEVKKDMIASYLKELPDTFKDGWSFMNMCIDKHQNHWCEQTTAMFLMALGIATKQMEYCAPKEMWDIFPGRMPYVRVLV